MTVSIQTHRATDTSQIFSNRNILRYQKPAAHQYRPFHRPHPHRGLTVHCSSSPQWSTWTYLAGTAAASHIIEKRTSLGSVLSSPLIAMILGALGVSLGILPHSSISYDVIGTYIMPIAAACYLLQCDLRDLVKKQNILALLGFINGLIGSVVGSVISYLIVGRFMGPEGSKIAGALCASLLGGSVNFVAVANLLKLSPAAPAYASAVTADNFGMLVYIAILMWLSLRDTASSGFTNASSSLTQEVGSSSGNDKSSTNIQANVLVNDEGIAITLAAAALSCFLGHKLAQATGLTNGLLAYSALIAPLIASAFNIVKGRKTHTNRLPNTVRQTDTLAATGTTNNNTSSSFPGAQAIGGALMPLFFATIGVSASGVQSLSSAGWVLIFVAVQLAIHMIICLGLGRWMKIPFSTVLVTANANVGGPATAVAMCAAKGWTKLVQPAILVGTLGYSISNVIGFAIGLWLATWY